jgi:hypothetical protein
MGVSFGREMRAVNEGMALDQRNYGEHDSQSLTESISARCQPTSPHRDVKSQS